MTYFDGLESISTTKDGECQNQNGNPSNLCSDGPANLGVVETESKDECADDLSSPVEGIVQGSGPGVEVCQVDTVELISVEPIRGKEHREQADDVRFASNGLPEAEQLRFPCRVLHEDDARTIFTNNRFCINQEPGQSSTTCSQHDETDVSSVGYGATAGRVDVFTKGNLEQSVRAFIIGNLCLTYQTTNDGTKVEDHPEPRDVPPLGILRRVRHHDSTLS